MASMAPFLYPQQTPGAPGFSPVPGLLAPPATPGGLLGQPQVPQGLLGRALGPGPHPVAGWLGGHSNALLMAGLGLLSGQGPKQGFANAAQGIAQGGQIDYARGKDRTEQARIAKEDAALAKLAQQYGLPADLPRDIEGPLLAAKLKPPDLPTSVQEFSMAQGNPAYAAFLDRGRTAKDSFHTLITPEERTAAGLAPEDKRFAQVDTAGQVHFPGTASTSVQIGNMTESQTASNTYATRMENAAPVIDRLENVGTDPVQAAASHLPLGVGNYAISPEYRQYQRAKEDFVRAALRKESGALISVEDQQYGDRMWFPVPGDDPQTIAEKRQARAVVMDSIRAGAGPRANKPYVPPSQDQTPAGIITLPDGTTVEPVQ